MPLHTRGYKKIHFQPDQFSRKFHRAAAAAFHEPPFDHDLLAFAEAVLAYPLGERLPGCGRRNGRIIREEADAVDLAGLLRARRERPRNRAAEQRDEFATAAHSITSSASSCNALGTSMPSNL